MVQYFLGDGNNIHRTFVAVFDWRVGNRTHFLAERNRASTPGSIGGLRIFVEIWLSCGMTLERLDQLVEFEIGVAVGQGIISGELAEFFWMEWVGSGRERMTHGLTPSEYEDNRDLCIGLD